MPFPSPISLNQTAVGVNQQWSRAVGSQRQRLCCPCAEGTGNCHLDVAPDSRAWLLPGFLALGAAPVALDQSQAVFPSPCCSSCSPGRLGSITAAAPHIYCGSCCGRALVLMTWRRCSWEFGCSINTDSTFSPLCVAPVAHL